MALGDFMRIEREERDGSRHYVVHTLDPKFSMELAPDFFVPDSIPTPPGVTLGARNR